MQKVCRVIPQENMKLLVQFEDGTVKSYDVAPLMDKWPQFAKLRDDTLFRKVRVDVGGYGIIWDDELDLSGDELFAEGVEASPEMAQLFKYKGYQASIAWSPEDNLFVGTVMGLRDSLNFHGESMSEAVEMFHQSIDNYMVLRQEIGKKPE